MEDALKLTTYFGERSRVQGRLLADELLDIQARREVRASVLLRGIQGFGAKHRKRSDRLLTLSEDLPLVSVAIDTAERIEGLAEEIGTIGYEGLISLERARLLNADGDTTGARLLDAGEGAAGLAVSHEDTVKLTVYLGRHERSDGTPAFVAVCQTLHEHGVAGATVLLGVDGTVHGERKRARFFARNADVPLMVIVVGEARRIESALRHLREMLERPMFTIELVQVCKRDGLLIQHPEAHRPPGCLDKLEQKLTVIVSEATRHDKGSVYLELIKRLRRAKAAGATSVRGIWGFHGDHPPHGDRLLALRRHVPVVTETIDSPERIAELFPIVDELTQDRGLITSELVPASSALHEAPSL
jgi:PII-like signaling protein